MNNIISIPAALLTDDNNKALRLDASNARQEGRLEVSTAAFWDGIVSTFGTGVKGSDTERADILRGVLVAVGEWSDGPQKKDGTRTPFGNVVQRFGARFDSAVKRATPDAPKEVVLRATLSGEGGGTVTIPADHPLYSQVVALIGASKQA